MAKKQKQTNSNVDVILNSSNCTAVYVRPDSIPFSRIRELEQITKEKAYYFQGITPAELSERLRQSLDGLALSSDQPKEGLFRHLLEGENYEIAIELIKHLQGSYN